MSFNNTDPFGNPWTQQGSENAGRHEGQMGGPLSPQGQQESTQSYWDRQRGYDEARRQEEERRRQQGG